jgi:phosphate starvation-inducible PhoH-like protein
MGKSKKIEDFYEDQINNIMNDIREGQSINDIKKIISKIISNDIKVVAKNNAQKKLISSIKNNEITICAGPAGTGKTFVAVTYALSLLRKLSNKYKKIYLVKSVTTLKGEELGYLKGDMRDKVDPFMWSFYINMDKVMKEESRKNLIDMDVIKPFPLAYMRGVTLDDCIIIADEMQNVSLDNSRTLLTRIGENSKVILLGDINQIDLRKKNESSLNILLGLFDDVEDIGTVLMEDKDTVRNPIIKTIENKYSEYYKNNS